MAVSRLALQLCSLALLLSFAAGYTGDTYEEKVKSWKQTHTQEEFIKQFNKEHNANVKGGRADRLYKHILSLLDTKAVRFTDNGMTYYLPITHYLSFLPDFVAEAIEAVTTILRIAYYKGLEFVHDEAIELHHVAIEWLNETGTVHVMLYVCVAYMGVSFLSWIVNRFSDGLTPQARALNKETRRKAQEYLASKRD